MNQMRFTICCLVMLVVAGGAFSLADSGRAEPIPEVQREPLYKFRNKKRQWLYKTSPTLPAGLLGGPWQNEGVVCFVARDAAPGFKPIYMVTKSNDYGAFYTYTVQSGAPDFIGGPGTMQNAGIAFYVANTKLPGTVLLRGFSIKAEFTPDARFVSGSGTYLFTTDPEAGPPSANWEKRGTLGYVWTSESTPETPDITPPVFPDLVVLKTVVHDSSVQAIVRNQGTGAISSNPGVGVQFRILESDGKETFSSYKSLGGMEPGQQIPITFTTLNHNISGRQYQIKLDYLNKVKESDESNNNTTPEPFPKLKINADQNSGDKVPVPAIVVTGKQDLPAKGGNPWARYSVTVHNWNKYPAAWFQSTKGQLPPGPCGDTRMQATFSVSLGGRIPGKVGCKALNSPQDFQSLEVETRTLADTDKIVITLLDRLTKEFYVSDPYTVGWQGSAELLTTIGCKYFLGRASHYLCTTDKGFNACENLRQAGKPIQCTRAGKPQP